MSMTYSEACEKYPIPKGLTVKQEEYHLRMQSIQGCAYADGYNAAEKEYVEMIEAYRFQVSNLTVKIAAAERRSNLAEEGNKAVVEMAVACLDSVQAMLENTDGGMTHRERNFCSQAMIKYIKSVRSSLKTSVEPTPF